LIDFQEEFGHPLTWKIEAKLHRFNINKKCQGYNKYTLIPAGFWMETINLKDICHECLKTFTKQEIEDLKFWLIVRKLKN